MAKPEDDLVKKTQERLKKHYGDKGSDKAVEEIAGAEPKGEGKGAGYPSRMLVHNVFNLGEAESERGTIPAPSDPSWNGWDALLDRMKTLAIT